MNATIPEDRVFDPDADAVFHQFRATFYKRFYIIRFTSLPSFLSTIHDPFDVFHSREIVVRRRREREREIGERVS